MPVLDVDALSDERVRAIQGYHSDTGIPRAELDLSGGIDSAVMAGLLGLALGADQLTVVYSSINSGSETQQRAQGLSEALGIHLIVHDLTSTYEAMIAAMRQNLVTAGFDEALITERIEKDNTILGSIRSCIRAPLGRGYLRMTGNGIRHGTGNECEDRWLRFYQKGGDGEVDSNPISMLSKGEVFQLAWGLGRRLQAEQAYQAIITAPPTPELWGEAVSHTDEDEIASYLGMTGCNHTFYSYVNPIDGDYSTVGLIERVARFNDCSAGSHLFDDDIDASALESMLSNASATPAFANIKEAIVRKVLSKARHTERITRHKFNPNCPAIGDRASLLKQAILTDELPPV